MLKGYFGFSEVGSMKYLSIVNGFPTEDGAPVWYSAVDSVGAPCTKAEAES